MQAGDRALSVKREADDVSECLHDVQPTTGEFSESDACWIFFCMSK